MIKKSKGVATSEITWHLFIILSVIILIAAVGLAIKSIVFDEYGKAPSGEVTVAKQGFFTRILASIKECNEVGEGGIIIGKKKNAIECAMEVFRIVS